MPKLLTSTHFRKNWNQHEQAWLWYWTTQSPNGEKIAVGGEGYARLDGAVNGFYAQQGIDWKPGKEVDNYTEEKFANDHYVISHYSEENVQNDTSNKASDSASG